MNQRSKLPFTIAPEYRREALRDISIAATVDTFSVFDAVLTVTIAAIFGAILGVML